MTGAVASASVDATVDAVRGGHVVVLPTDTVYGLCATPHREDAAERVARLKGRDAATPIALLASDVDTLVECVPELSGRVGALVRALLPAPLTLVVPNPARRFGWLVRARPGTIGVRVPRLDGPAREALDRLGVVLATSANRHGEPAPRRLGDVPAEIREACGALLDGGELPGTASTVLDLTGPEPRILREGAVPAAEALARAAAA